MLNHINELKEYYSHFNFWQIFLTTTTLKASYFIIKDKDVLSDDIMSFMINKAIYDRMCKFYLLF